MLSYLSCGRAARSRSESMAGTNNVPSLKNISGWPALYGSDLFFEELVVEPRAAREHVSGCLRRMTMCFGNAIRRSPHEAALDELLNLS